MTSTRKMKQNLRHAAEALDLSCSGLKDTTNLPSVIGKEARGGGAMPKSSHYTVVVIGTGFGGTMTALPLACEFVRRKKAETILMLERGTWWTTPVGTVQDKEVKTYDFLVQKGQPVQFWSTPNNFRGFVDIFTRCLRRKKNEDVHEIGRAHV